MPHAVPPANAFESSVAGEEDPGAAADACAPSVPLAPGDEAAAGTPGTGEDVCRACGGSGMLNGGACPECEGTGRITACIGGA